jgi:hypothetical protein
MQLHPCRYLFYETCSNCKFIHLQIAGGFYENATAWKALHTSLIVSIAS